MNLLPQSRPSTEIWKVLSQADEVKLAPAIVQSRRRRAQAKETLNTRVHMENQDKHLQF